MGLVVDLGPIDGHAQQEADDQQAMAAVGALSLEAAANESTAELGINGDGL